MNNSKRINDLLRLQSRISDAIREEVSENLRTKPRSSDIKDRIRYILEDTPISNLEYKIFEVVRVEDNAVIALCTEDTFADNAIALWNGFFPEQKLGVKVKDVSNLTENEHEMLNCVVVDGNRYTVNN